jgi:hypothetical protein
MHPVGNIRKPSIRVDLRQFPIRSYRLTTQSVFLFYVVSNSSRIA